jgi:MYXO-CTERM domain-containing protein
MRPIIFFVALTVLAPSTQAMAQTNSADEIDVGDTRGDDNSKLGLLGLLGLAGLLGLKRREPDIHVDARRDKHEG